MALTGGVQTRKGMVAAARTKSRSVVSRVASWAMANWAMIASIVANWVPARRQRLLNLAAAM